VPLIPFIVSALVVASAALSAVGLAMDGDPFAGAPAAVLAVSLVVHALIATTGLLVARSRWARRHDLGVVGASLAIGLVVPLDGWSLAASLAAGGALALLAGPWLRRGWIRHLPSTDGPPTQAIVLVIGLLALPAVAAVSSPMDLTAWSWVLVGVAVVLALGLSRASIAALWASRLIVPALGAAAGLSEGIPGGPVIAATAIALGAVAWTREVGLSVAPLDPRKERPVPTPPELMDPSILEAAGYDDRGRPLEDS